MDPTHAVGGATEKPALPAALRGLRVAIVHDWLTGLRGGEKCLEVVCAAFPDATLHTLIHREGAVGPTIGGMAIRTSPLQRLPGVFRHYRHLLPVMPLAARSWRVGEVDPPAGATVVVYCHHGVRSLTGAAFLERAGVANVASLAGGIDAWSARVDPAVPRY